MNILLTRPLNQTPMLIPNIGLGYLATALRQAGHKVTILDCIRDKIDVTQFFTVVKQSAYNLIGFQVYTFDVGVLPAYLQAAHEALPSAYLVTGGPHPTAQSEEMLAQFSLLDALFCGEAEPGLPRLCSLLDGKPHQPLSKLYQQEFQEELSLIPGLVFRTDENIVVRNQPQFVPDLDATGFPAWDLLGPEKYPPAPQGTFTRRLPVAPIIVTRGCPYECTFCAAHLMAGRRLRSRSPQNVVDEIVFLCENYGIREIHIEDDNFSLNRKLVKNFCLELLNRNIDVTWSCPNGLRLDSLDKELIQLMEKAGCYSIALGIESGSQRIIDLMKKKLNVVEVTEKIALIRQNSDIKITGFFIIGYPGETVSEIKQTIRFSLQLDLDKVNFGAFMPLPGTSAFEELKQQGVLENLDYSRITEYRTAFTFGELSTRKLRFLLQWSFFRFYIRPHVIFRFLKEIKSFHQVRVLGRRLLEVFWR
ncbi:B12-binding domain-containing radical SAM protein [candidate division CSSED10-310 bacterium]|uniref:B12-binding domain-containing radical SAM protein n=1 Tax=candidate division CSSED10-310 bacterium TaxID=2855610 RepID=A0ABV6YSK8_UNCC1